MGRRAHPNSEACSGTENLLRGLLPDPGLCPKMTTELVEPQNAEKVVKRLESKRGTVLEK